METSEPVLKRLSKIALCAMGVLAILSAIYWKERIFFADFAFSAFSILNNGPYFMLNHRYGEAILQVMPYLEGKMHLPLKTILFSYSVSVNIFYLLVAALLVYGFRQYRLSIVMALFYFLFTSASFMTPTDVALGVAFMFLLFATTVFLSNRGVNFFVLLLSFFILAFLTISTHLIVLIPTVFLWVYLVIEKKYWPFSAKKTMMLSVCLALAFFLKYLTIALEPAGYDNEHMHGVTHFSINDIVRTFSSPVVRIFLYRCFINYWVAIPVFFAGIAALIVKKQMSLAIWTFISVIGYLILMGLTYGDFGADILLWHIEGEWAAISIIVAIPFVFAFLPSLKMPVAVIILSIIFLTRLVYITAAIPDFVWRVHFESDVLTQIKKKNITKLALYNTPYIAQKMILTWALPYEATLISAMDGDKPQRTFFLVSTDDLQVKKQVTESNGYFNAWQMTTVDGFNRQYFSFDTTRPYTIISYEELMK